MKKEEFNTLVKGMKAVYSDPKFIADKDAFNVWYSLLQDLEYKNASIAVQKYMMINKFPPTIADIRAEYVNITYPQELNESESWELVIKALNEVEKSGLAKKKFEALPELVRKAVGGYAQFLELSDSPGTRQTAKTNFIKAYVKLLEKDLEVKRLQPEIRKIIEQKEISAQIEQKGNIEEIEEEEEPGDDWADIPVPERPEGYWDF